MKNHRSRPVPGETPAEREARLTESLHIRLYAGLVTTEETYRGVPHRIWTGALDRGGYGIIFDGLHGNNRKVHRLVWQIERGEIPDETIDHYCGRKDCSEPIHVEPASFAENTRRAEGWLHQVAKTHCPQGHPYDEENTQHITRVVKGKIYAGRHCRACNRAKALEIYHRKARQRAGLQAANN
jgi:hypothetical protein